MAEAPFSPDLLEVCPLLWGNFWQGDVISPGYRLPAVELALLRATRLDRNWPISTTPEQFLADLRATIQHPEATLEIMSAAHEPCWLIKAPTGLQEQFTVVWYCQTTGCLHAGYRTRPHAPSDWLPEATAGQSPTLNLVARLDQAILRIRYGLVH